jgi:transcriptional regulator
MRHNPFHEETNEAVVRRLIAENPWATLVSHTDEGLVASHYPILLDEDSEELAILSHVGRPDEKAHRLGEAEMLVIVAGPHGYVSPTWYVEGATPAPTWNFSVAHCYGVPQLLDGEENLRVLTRLVAHFEKHVPGSKPLDQEAGGQLAKGTVGIRLPITRFVCKIKMSRDKDPESQRQVLEHLRREGPYRNEALAADMERALGLAERSDSG